MTAKAFRFDSLLKATTSEERARLVQLFYGNVSTQVLRTITQETRVSEDTERGENVKGLLVSVNYTVLCQVER